MICQLLKEVEVEPVHNVHMCCCSSSLHFCNCNTYTALSFIVVSSVPV